MEEMNWYYVRVINLSDIRELHNSKLLSRIKGFETKSLSCVHSIFSPNRRSELTDTMKIKEDAPTILAWGTNKFLLKYVHVCKIFLDQRKCLGINAGASQDFYYHPLTSKTSWITEILGKL